MPIIETYVCTRHNAGWTVNPISAEPWWCRVCGDKSHTLKRGEYLAIPLTGGAV